MAFPIVNNKFYVNNIEVSISSIASSIKVNRRTLYETIKFVNDNPVIKEVMENVSAVPDIKKISLLMENEIVTIYIDRGMYSRVTPEIMDAIEKYMSNIKEIYSVNSDYETNFIRLIFYNEVDESLFKIFNGKEIIINDNAITSYVRKGTNMRPCRQYNDRQIKG
jgi:Predicted regulator of amino acid metabolism, contains ACT domain